jgi:hypothetical protein
MNGMLETINELQFMPVNSHQQYTTLGRCFLPSRGLDIGIASVPLRSCIKFILLYLRGFFFFTSTRQMASLMQY